MLDKEKSSPIFIAGGSGMVGSAIIRALKEKKFSNILHPTHKELDLSNQKETFDFLKSTEPYTVIIAAARVGGIHANNTYPAQFIYDNLAIGTNLIHGSFLAGVKKLIFLGSSCIYPRNAPQPLQENALLTSPLEPTNEAYALAKIACLKQCQFYRKQYGVNFFSVMPTNLYGPKDNYHPENSHVLPALIQRFHFAKMQNLETVSIWGTGTPLREFLHVADLADAVLHLLTLNPPSIPDWVNIGSSIEISIKDLGLMIKKIVDFKGAIHFDTSKPDGTPRKILDSSKIKNLGWAPKISLESGIRQTYQDFLQETNH